MNKYQLTAIAILGWAFAGCGNDAKPTVKPGFDPATASIEQCVKNVGWQYDYVIAADMNGIPNANGDVCTDGATATWFEESTNSNAFTQVMAWDSVGSCGPRTPTPAVDGALCTFTGTHTWKAVSGISTHSRMVLTETIDTVSGSFSGQGVDDQCGPASVLAGTSVDYVVTLDGACESGTKLLVWQPIDNTSEAAPGRAFTDPNGTALPAVVCTNPGAVGPEDHLPDRKICATEDSIVD